MDCFGIFEGGGAKGLAYAGVVRAIQDRQALRFKGYAGTSAGAIVAALLAAGFDWREIFDYEDGTEEPTGALDIEFARYFGGRASGWNAGAYRLYQSLKLVQPILQALYAATGSGFSLDAFVRYFNQILWDRLGERATSKDGVIRFYDMPSDVDLRIVATNLTKGEMTVFSRHFPYFGASVADAVGASIAAPGVFRPRRLFLKLTPDDPGQDHVFVDGGLTCNFPFYLFEADRPWPEGQLVPVVGFRLTEPPGRRVANMVRMLTATISGAQDPRHLPVRNLRLFETPVAIGTFDFLLSAGKKREACREACDRASASLNNMLALLSRSKVTDLLEALRENVAEVTGLELAQLRANIMVRVRDPGPAPGDFGDHMVLFSASDNPDSDHDDCLLLPIGHGAAGRVYQSLEPLECDLRRVGHQQLGLNKYQRRLVKEGMVGIYSFPVLVEGTGGDGDRVLGVLNLDVFGDADPTLLWKDHTVDTQVRYALAFLMILLRGET